MRHTLNVTMTLVVLATIIISSVTFAVPPTPTKVNIMSMKQWRQRQINDGKNLITRLSNRIARIKATSGNLEQIRRLESERRIAAQNSELLAALTVEDYFNFYLSSHVKSDAALHAAALKMTRREVAGLIKILLEKVRDGSVAMQPSPGLINMALQRQELGEPIQGL